MKKKVSNLHQALTFHLEGLYDVEKRLQKEIPKCAERVSSPVLQQIMKSYAKGSKERRLKLKRIFTYLLAGPYGRRCRVIDRMLKEAHETLDMVSADDLRDIMFQSCMQAIVHYKISSYNSAMAFALELDLNEVGDLLEEILETERETVRKLNGLGHAVGSTQIVE